MSLAKQIGSVAKTALTNAGHMSMNNEIYARISDATAAALHLEAIAPGYKECIDREAECVNRVTKSASTAQLEAKDKERDKTLRLEPTEAINAFIDTVNQIFRKYKNLIAAKENYEIAMERYLLGDLPGIEMREAQKSLLDAEERILTAKYNTKVCEISLQQISGNVMTYME